MDKIPRRYPVHHKRYTLPDTLKGEIVEFRLAYTIKDAVNSKGESFHTNSHVLLVLNIDETHVHGSLIAAQVSVSSIHRGVITGYRILGRKDLPLLIGYEYTTDLLSHLIKG